MSARLAALAAALVVVVATPAAAAGKDQKLAVLDARGAGTKADLAAWTSALRTGAESALVDPRITLLDEKAQKKALQRARPCKQAPAVCAVDAGKALGATLVVVADVQKQGKRRAVSFVLVDVDTGAVVVEDKADLAAAEVRSAMQARGAKLVADALKARAPKKPKAEPPKPAPPPEPADTFSRDFGGALLAPEGTVQGTLTLTAKTLSFEPDPKAQLRAWEEIPLLEVARVEPFNHMMMLPTGVQITTTTGRVVKLLVVDDRPRVLQLIETRVGIAKDRQKAAAAPPPAPAPPAPPPNPDAGG